MIFYLILMVATYTDNTQLHQSEEVLERTRLAARGLNADIDRYSNYLKKYKKGRIDKRLKSTSKENGTIKFPNKETKAKEIKELNSKIELFKNTIRLYDARLLFYYGYLNAPYSIGDFGLINENKSAKVIQVIDNKTMLIKWGDVLMVKGVSTKGATDDNFFELPQVFEVTGTETYQTSTGSNTVFVLEVLDTAKIEKILQK